MNGLETLVDDAMQEPLAAARAHAAAGGRVVGYVGAEVPVELILASGAFPLRLPSFATSNSSVADLYLESTFTPDVRSIAEQYLQGSFDFLDSIVLPRSADSAQRLYYYLSELESRGIKRGPVLLIFDLAKIPRGTSEFHSRAAAERLAGQLGVRMSELPMAIERLNSRRRLFRAAAETRRAAGILGSTMNRALRAAGLCQIQTFDAALSVWLQQSARPPKGPRVVLVGSAPPDERLHRAVEAGGGNVIAEDGDYPSCSFVMPEIADGTLAAVADHYQRQTLGSRAFVDRAQTTRAFAQAAGADGVIVWLTEQEDALIWDLPVQMAALTAAGIPALSLARRRWDASDGALDEITAFTRTLGATA